MRPVWTGHLVAGEVGIPVKLFKTADHVDVSFKSVHATCLNPLKQTRSCPTCKVEIRGAGATSETARAIEISPGVLVEVSNDELSAVLGGDQIPVEHFWPAGEIPAERRSTAYWAFPFDDKLSASAHAAFTIALDDEGLAGFGTIALYSKERVVAFQAVRDSNDELRLLAQLLFTTADLRTMPPRDFDGIAVSEKAVDLARQYARERVPARPFLHKLTAGDRVRELVDAKTSGGEIRTVETTTTTAPLDLEAALQRSLRKRQRRDPRATART